MFFKLGHIIMTYSITIKSCTRLYDNKTNIRIVVCLFFCIYIYIHDFNWRQISTVLCRTRLWITSWMQFRSKFWFLDPPQVWISILRIIYTHTVDGQNPAPPRMMIIPLFIGLKPSQVVSRILSINSIFLQIDWLDVFKIILNPTVLSQRCWNLVVVLAWYPLQPSWAREPRMFRKK